MKRLKPDPFRSTPSKPSNENSDIKTKDLEFNADDFVGSVEAFAHHLTGKQKLGLRTAMMSIPSVTAASCERRRRKPIEAALRLLYIARKHTEVLVAG